MVRTVEIKGLVGSRPVFWLPIPVSEDMYEDLERNRHIPSVLFFPGAEPESYREDHARVLINVPADDRWYCIGRCRHGEASAFRSRVGRGVYGYLTVSSLPAPNLNDNDTGPADYQMLFVKRSA